MVRGYIRAPNFEFSTNKLDFGKCSYLFEEIREF